MNLLPNYERAVLPIEKLTNYCLNAEHPEGKHKAFVFEKVLGLTLADAQWLKAKILDNLAFYGAKEMEENEFGRKYMVEMAIEKEGNKANVRTVWIIEKSDLAPRLVSCYIKQ
jgi:hemerythrin-like domain-containing protein